MENKDRLKKQDKKYKNADSFYNGEKRFRLLVEQIPLGYQSLNADGYIVDVNQEWLNIMEYSRGEILGRWLGDFLTPEYVESFMKGFSLYKKSGEIHGIELEMVKKDGSIIIVSFDGKIEYDNEGSFSQTHCIMSNITERKKMERLLTESEEKYRALVEGASDAMVLVDIHGNVLEVNRQAEKLTGYSKNELLGLHIGRIHPKEEIERTLKCFEEIVRQGSGLFCNGIILRKNGDTVPVDITGSVIRFSDKIIVQGIFRDVTEQNKHEKALKEAEEKYRNIYENAMVGIFQSTPEGRLLNVNPSLARIHAYESPEDMIQDIADISLKIYPNPDDRKRWRKQVEGQGVAQGFEMQLYRKDKKKIWVSMNVCAVRDTDGKVLYYEGIVEDITVRKQAEKRLKKSQEKLKSLAAKLAETEEDKRQRLAQELHDKLGQNLTAIGINLNIIKSKLPDEVKESIKSHIDDSIALVGQTAECVRDLMAELRTPVLDDYGLVVALKWYGEQYAGRTGIQVIVQGLEPEPRLERRIEQAMFHIFQEALTNTAKHAKATKIAVRIEERNRTVKLIIKDNGIGFDYHRLIVSGRRNAYRGWGLMIMTERAETIGGHLHIESAPGKGTMVVIEIIR
ncbi:MAG: PAS domain S-box protein [Proteobacteria bacterium]|nr:PAS domain S-box protein [Pseudomonadota bacterium]